MASERRRRQDLASTETNPVPPGAIAGYVVSSGGMRLRFARWRPTGRRHKGTVCIFSGRGEFIEKYFETITDLRRKGFAVTIMDWRGQGGSDRLLANGHKGHVDTFADYDRDVAAFMTEIALPDCPAPYFALAHSMGGAIILRTAHRRDCWFDRIILSSPMIEMYHACGRKPFLTTVASAVSFCGFGESYIPGGRDLALEQHPFVGNSLTSDAVRYTRNGKILEAAPQLAVGSPTWQWFYAAKLAMEAMQAPEFAENICVPILMVGAGDDQIVSSSATELLCAHTRMGKYVMIPNARHELLMEHDAAREQFWVAFDAFIPGSKG